MTIDRIEHVRDLRQLHWSEHPILAANAILPTRPLANSLSLVIRGGSRHRTSQAFWADPLSGKSSCLAALIRFLPEHFPGCGVFLYEAKHMASVPAEGSFLEDLLGELEFEPKVARSLAGKREQVFRALYALSAQARHLFLLVDEAQELFELELRWLKSLINRLSSHHIRVTVVLFGQRELRQLRDDLVARGRSDIYVRFMERLYHFENLTTSKDLVTIFSAIDERSEFPDKSGISYTEFIWPCAFANGFRLEPEAKRAWEAFVALSPKGRMPDGLGIRWLAEALACAAENLRERDAPDFVMTTDDWVKAIVATEYGGNVQPEIGG